ncbi:non-canonical purine NTP pyrophosphatase [Oceanobacillus picturae]|uniref:Non-canonical purine NTP pyrophosphatase n=1 Tax=Oceanobacillus picturae TaxID=171693 RepID=A0A0U9HFI4_9BACI|nr:non-canonical purine NTP pyrophosphatase [Oceanobacillus picturae]GAQ19016.1 non-canonical purine NTP pyrophosphatase [Oceanobacillus picturae]
MKIIVATWNEVKLEQIQMALKDIPLDISSLPKDMGDVEETAITFKGNAQLKIETVKRYYPNDIIVGEDSGLTIDALEGFPGVKTARFSPGSDANRAQLLIDKLKGIPLSKRTAQFISVVALAFPDGKVLHCQGTMNGWIAKDTPGELKGYGDIFLLSNDKVLTEHLEQIISPYDHRQIALFQAKQLIIDWLERKTT